MKNEAKTFLNKNKDKKAFIILFSVAIYKNNRSL